MDWLPRRPLPHLISALRVRFLVSSHGVRCGEQPCHVKRLSIYIAILRISGGVVSVNLKSSSGTSAGGDLFLDVTSSECTETSSCIDCAALPPIHPIIQASACILAVAFVSAESGE
jgi:hypothetical protein